MNATPDRDKSDKSDTPILTRREQFEKEGFDDLEMPKCDCTYLLSYLIEMGVATGENALTFVEMASWQHASGITLDAWELTLIRRLSEAYLGESHKARKIDAVAPWLDAPYVKVAPNRVAIQMQRAIQALAKL